MLNTDESRLPSQLRQTAEFRLKDANTPGTKGWTIGAAALTLLHRLSSDPTTASDALKLLHELQVHQVELDLQHEQMEEDRHALEESARHYAELHDLAPVAYFTVDSANKIIEGNFAGAQMLGVEQHDLEGHRVDALVAAGSRPALLTLLEQVRSGGLRHSYRAQANGDGSGWLEVAASFSPCGQSCLVAAMDLSDARK